MKFGCKKCQTQYVGESNRSLQSRFSEHLGYVKNQQVSKATGEHFSMKGHQISDMEISIIENYLTQVTCSESKERKCLFRSSIQNTGA